MDLVCVHTTLYCSTKYKYSSSNWSLTVTLFFMSFTLPSSSTNLDPASSAPGNESRKRKRAQSEAPVESPSVDVHLMILWRPRYSLTVFMIACPKTFTPGADGVRPEVLRRSTVTISHHCCWAVILIRNLCLVVIPSQWPLYRIIEKELRN